IQLLIRIGHLDPSYLCPSQKVGILSLWTHRFVLYLLRYRKNFRFPNLKHSIYVYH
ncbi:hypothetical protein BDF21DRAFT_434330, partial [Thamnidium elegans]